MDQIEARKTNFIYQMINTDLTSQKHKLVHTRFSPEPNGYLHIGHAKSICLNFGIAKDYNGQCNLRFDDTNPTQEDIEFVESIKYDLKWLGFKWSGDIRYASNYFDQLYQYAIELITKGFAYVDELSSDQIREYRGTLTQPGKDSPYSSRGVQENLELFEKMRQGEFDEGAACLRARIDMSSPFIIMRDPVLYRIKFERHHQTDNKWCIYPMYDFTHCISDALEGITHSLCTLEFQDNRRLYNWILEHISISCHPNQYEFARLNLEYTIMSKRNLKKLVTDKHVDGWDDPRMPTLSGLRRRGYTANSIRKFCDRIGVTRQESIVEMVALESCVRDELNQNAPRVMAVLEPVKVIIENMSLEVEVLTMPNHPNKPEMGSRKVLFSREIYIDRADFKEKSNKQYKRLVLGKEVRLRYAYVIKANRVQKNREGEIITIFCSYDAGTLSQDPADGRKVKGVIHWVSALYALPAEIRLYDHLFSIQNPAASSDLIATLNPRSLVIKHGFVEPSVASSRQEVVYQFEREGYFFADSANSSVDHIVFNRTVSLCNSRKK